MAQTKSDCRSPVGLDCCNCCLDLAHRSEENNNPGSPTVSNFRQLQEKLVFENLNADKLNNIMRQDSLEPVLRDPCYLLNEGICNRNIDQTMLSILLFFHRWVPGQSGARGAGEDASWPTTTSAGPSSPIEGAARKFQRGNREGGGQVHGLPSTDCGPGASYPEDCVALRAWRE